MPSGLTLVLLPSEVQQLWGLMAADQKIGPSFKGQCGDSVRKLLDNALACDWIKPGSFQCEVIGSFFVDLLAHAKSSCLTPRKAAVLVALARALFEAMRSRSKTTIRVGEVLSVSELFLEYKRLLLLHTQAQAPSSTATPGHLSIFTLPEVRQITEFMSGTLFQHFLLYQSVLICPQESVAGHVELTVERPRRPPDLNKAKLRAKPVQSTPEHVGPQAGRPPTEQADGAQEDEEPLNRTTTFNDQVEDDSTLVDPHPLGANKERRESLTVDEHHQKATTAASAQLAETIGQHDEPIHKRL